MEPDNNDTRPCPCCGDPLSERQIRRHLARYRRRLQQDLAVLDVGIHLDLPHAGPAHDGAVPAPDEADPAPGIVDGLIGMDEDKDKGGGEGEGGDEGEDEQMGNQELDGAPNMNLVVDDDGLPTLPPELPPAQGLRRNPPVTIEDWPDPDDTFVASEDDESIDGADQDPEFVERDAPLGLDPDDEPALNDDDLLALLEAELGDLAEEEWIDMYARDLSDRDRTTLAFLASRLRTHFSRQTYDDLRRGVCEPLDIPSEFVAWRRLRILSELETRAYDCCINSCCCFLGRYADLDRCSFCQEPRHNAAGKPRRSFRYTPLIPQLQGLFQTKESIKRMRYRSKAEAAHEPGKYFDVFDGENYRTLRRTQVCEGNDYQFFDSPDDIALSLSTDGFTLFKRRRRGFSTAWPILLVNLNLHPSIRTRLENVICVGVIPGPKQCKDLTSFLVPLIEELVTLADGVESSKVVYDADDDNADEPAARNENNAEGVYFVLRAFIIILFGDIPAISKLLSIKGHNAVTPCRACYIRGVLCRLAKNSVYYVPLTAPTDEEVFPADALLMRTQASFLFHYAELDAARTNVARAKIAQDSGITSRSIFARLKSIDLASCAPYDIMHLLFENLVPNMIKHWTGDFKGLDQGSGSYELSQDHWAEIGRQTAKAAKTIPSCFVGTLPNIAEDGNFYKADAYSFWFQYIAPIVLKDRLPETYYDHFLLMREIFIWCLEWEITSAQIDDLERMVNEWVQQYEELYYQYQQKRLPACPLTIHALLHLPYYIRRTGPLWASWAFVMERFCGHLLPAVKSRVRPYENLDNYIQRRAQMQIVSCVYNMPSLRRPKVNYTYQAGECLSSRERMYPAFPDYIVGTPINRNLHVNLRLTNELTKYFGVAYEGKLRARELRERIDMTTLVRYGRFRLVSDGNKIRVADLIARDPSSRDNSFIRYQLLADANTRYRNLPDRPVRVTYYGQVTDVYYVEFIEDLQTDRRKPYLLVRVKECNTGGVDAALPQSPFVKYNRLSTTDIIHIETVNAVVGRVQLNHNTWAIVDQSRNGARTQFVDDEGNEID